MSDITKFCLKPEHEEILKKRPRAPWIDDVPEGDYITPYPTYEVGKLFHLFELCSPCNFPHGENHTASRLILYCLQRLVYQPYYQPISRSQLFKFRSRSRRE